MNWGWLKVPKASIKFQFKTPQALAKIRAAGNDALSITGFQAIQDTEKYVPRDQNNLRDSAYTSSDRNAENGQFTARWSEPYAQYLYNGEVMHGNPTSRTYGPEKLTFTEALARAEWAKYAHEIFGAQWEKVYQAALRRFMR